MFEIVAEVHNAFKQWNCERLIIKAMTLISYMDNCGNSNTSIKARFFIAYTGLKPIEL